MEDMTATYSPEDNKLRLYSLHRLDADTYAAVKAAGFGWAPRQQLFVAPMWTPEREDLLLSLCGEISDEDTSLVDRAEERAERFEDYSDKRASEAEQARESVARIADGIPLGQPILVGHHSERRARKDAERIDNGMRKAVNLWETSKYWQQRAAGALRHAKYKERPDVRARRIKTLEAERRKMERHYKECEMWRKLWGKEGLTLEAARKLANLCYLTVEAETAERPYSISAYTVLEENSRWPWPVERVQEVAEAHYSQCLARYARWMAHYDNRLAYENAMLGESGGIAADRFDIKPGGRVLVRGEWVTVLRVNRKDGVITSVTTNARYVPKRSIEEVEDYMEPTEEAAAAAAEVSKKPPLCNYPGKGFEHITKAEWDDQGSDYKSTCELGKGGVNRYRDYNTPETLAYARHRVRYLFRRMSLMPVYITDMKRKDPAPAGAAQQESPKLQAPERDVYGMLAAQDRKKEPTEQEQAFDALRDQLDAGPTKVVAAPQLFPTPPAIAARMVEAADISPRHSVLEPSAGTGNLLRAMEDGTITAVEVNASLVERLYQDFPAVDVRCADFLSCNGDLGKFDRIVMNPPFKNGEDIKHIQHAAGMLKPGGRLVALCADGPRQGEKLRGLCDSWESLPEGSFSACGTGVRVAMLVITKPEASRPLEDEHDATQETMQEATEEAMQETTPCPAEAVAVAVATQQDARPFDLSLYSRSTGPRLQRSMITEGGKMTGGAWAAGNYNNRHGALNSQVWLAEGILPADVVVMPAEGPYNLTWAFEFTEALGSPIAEVKRIGKKSFSPKNSQLVFDHGGLVILLPLLAYLYILRLFPGVKFMAVADGKRRYEKPIAAVVDGEVKALVMPIGEARYVNCNDTLERYRHAAKTGVLLGEYEPIPGDAKTESPAASCGPAPANHAPLRDVLLGFNQDGKAVVVDRLGRRYIQHEGWQTAVPLDMEDGSYPKTPEALAAQGLHDYLTKEEADTLQEAMQPEATETASQPALHDAYPFQFPGDATFRDYDTGEPLADQQYEGLALVGRELALMVTWLDGKERAWELPASPSLGMAGPSCAYLPMFCYTESSRSLAPVLHDAHVALGRMTPREYRRMVYDATMEGLRKGWEMVLATYTKASTVVDHAIKFDDARGEIMHRVGKSWYVVEYGMLDGLASQLGLPTSYDHRRAQWAIKPVEEVAPIEEDVPEAPLSEAEQEAMAAKARATVEHLVLQRAQWTTLDGVDVLQIPGSNYAAVPCTGRKDARRFTVFTMDEREEYCQLTRKEVYDWLYDVAKTEIEEAEEFLATYTAPSRSPSPAVPSFAEFVQHCKEMNRQGTEERVTRYTEELRRLESGEPPATPMEMVYWRNRDDRIAELMGMIAEVQTDLPGSFQTS